MSQELNKEIKDFYAALSASILEEPTVTPDCTHILSWVVYPLIQKVDGNVVSFEVANEEQHRCDYCPRCGEKL